ncbi:TetR/AcrR family transcriptional regulator C-terminal domain-containing protein [Actinoplanes sp. NPDC000266]
MSASSIHHHFPGGREAIVEAIRGLLAGENLPLEPGDGDWRTFADRWARAYRASFARHPEVVPFLTAQTVSDPLTLSAYETLAQVPRAGGFRDEDLLHAVTILDCLVLGSALDAGAPLDVWPPHPTRIRPWAPRSAPPGPTRATVRSAPSRSARASS